MHEFGSLKEQINKINIEHTNVGTGLNTAEMESIDRTTFTRKVPMFHTSANPSLEQ